MKDTPIISSSVFFENDNLTDRFYSSSYYILQSPQMIFLTRRVGMCRAQSYMSRLKRNGEVSGSEAEDGKERAGIDMLKNSFSNALSRDRHTHRSRSYSMPGEFIYRKKRISV